MFLYPVFLYMEGYIIIRINCNYYYYYYLKLKHNDPKIMTFSIQKRKKRRYNGFGSEETWIPHNE